MVTIGREIIELHMKLHVRVGKDFTFRWKIPLNRDDDGHS